MNNNIHAFLWNCALILTPLAYVEKIFFLAQQMKMQHLSETVYII